MKKEELNISNNDLKIKIQKQIDDFQGKNSDIKKYFKKPKNKKRFKEELEILTGKHVESGIFGADMKVSLINDGPVTIILDTKII